MSIARFLNEGLIWYKILEFGIEFQDGVNCPDEIGTKLISHFRCTQISSVHNHLLELWKNIPPEKLPGIKFVEKEDDRDTDNINKVNEECIDLVVSAGSKLIEHTSTNEPSEPFEPYEPFKEKSEVKNNPIKRELLYPATATTTFPKWKSSTGGVQSRSE